MKYWVVKGRPSENEFQSFFKSGKTDQWYTSRPPKRWSEGDRLFFWRGAPACEIVGLGEFCDIGAGVNDGGKRKFDVRYETPLLSNPVGIDVLRAEPVVGTASFLKSGPSGTVFPITTEQARRIYELVRERNAGVGAVWPDLDERELKP